MGLDGTCALEHIPEGEMSVIFFEPDGPVTIPDHEIDRGRAAYEAWQQLQIRRFPGRFPVYHLRYRAAALFPRYEGEATFLYPD